MDATQRRSGRGAERSQDVGPSIVPTPFNKPTRFRSDARFRVDLPEVLPVAWAVGLKMAQVVCDMKSLATPFDAAELSKFRLTSEEKLPSTEIMFPEFLGFEFGVAALEKYRDLTRSPSPDAGGDLSDPDSIDSRPSLDEADYEILDAVESVTGAKWVLDAGTMLTKPREKKRLPISLKTVDPERWWLRDSQEDRKAQIQPLNLQKRSRKRKVRRFASREAYIRSIEKGFEKAQNPPQSRAAQLTSSTQGGRSSAVQSKARKAVAVYDVVPHEDPNGRPFAMVNFHNNCVNDSDKLIPHSSAYSAQICENVLLKELYVEPKSVQEAEVNRALGFDNKYLGLMAPCFIHSSTDRRDSAVAGQAEYLWIREYVYRKVTGKDLGKWRWAIRFDREKQKAEMIPIEQRFITRKEKLRSVIPRPISVNVIDRDASEDVDIFD